MPTFRIELATPKLKKNKNIKRKGYQICGKGLFNQVGDSIKAELSVLNIFCRFFSFTNGRNYTYL